jgi:hypothetical protein
MNKADIDGSIYGEPVPLFYDTGAPTNVDSSTTTSALVL